MLLFVMFQESSMITRKKLKAKPPYNLHKCLFPTIMISHKDYIGLLNVHGHALNAVSALVFH